MNIRVTVQRQNLIVYSITTGNGNNVKVEYMLDEDNLFITREMMRSGKGIPKFIHDALIDDNNPLLGNFNTIVTNSEGRSVNGEVLTEESVPTTSDHMVRAYHNMCNCGSYYVESEEYIRLRLHTFKTSNSKGTRYNRIRLYNSEGLSRRVRHTTYKKALSEGWSIDGRPFHKARVYMSKGDIVERVKAIDINSRDDTGWVRVTRIIINNGTVDRYIPHSELSNFELDGWVAGSYRDYSTSGGRMVITRGGIDKVIDPGDLDHWLSHGFSRGSVNKGRIAINKSGVSKFIRPNQIERWLSEGYSRGFSER